MLHYLGRSLRDHLHTHTCIMGMYLFKPDFIIGNEKIKRSAYGSRVRDGFMDKTQQKKKFKFRKKKLCESTA